MALACGLAVAVLLAGCAETRFLVHTAKRVTGSAETPEAQGRYKVGKPYQIKGTWYYPREDYSYDKTGIASWYGAAFHGRATANGEVYDMNALTAAHRVLPMPSFVRVTNLENGRSLIVRVNDRGPFAKGRIIDMSRRGAQLLGFQKNGTARVRVQILADRSRAVATRMKAQVQLAKVGSPITVDRLPKPAVNTQSLPPPTTPAGEAKAPEPVAPSPTPAPLPVQPATPPAPAAPTVTASAIEPVAAPSATEAAVSQSPVTPTSLFVQVGAFGVHENALKMQARLASVGSVKLKHKLINGRDIYRVRIGPLASVADADRMLESVVGTGYPDARIVVD